METASEAAQISRAAHEVDHPSTQYRCVGWKFEVWRNMEKAACIV